MFRWTIVNWSKIQLNLTASKVRPPKYNFNKIGHMICKGPYKINLKTNELESIAQEHLNNFSIMLDVLFLVKLMQLNSDLPGVVQQTHMQPLGKHVSFVALNINL